MFTIGHKTNIGRKHSEETKKKIGATKVGKSRPLEMRKKLSLLKTGSKLSEETKRKISESMRGRNGYWFGKKLSEETKSKLRVANFGKKLSEETKKKLTKNIVKVNERILKEIKEYQENGYRCVPTGGKVRPDFIAIKDGKVLAVEVEYGSNPNYSKYTEEDKLFFDDVVWIIRRRKGYDIPK